MSATPTILYTKTDEAPALATHSLLPIVQAFASQAGVAVELRDISLAGRILAAFRDRLPEHQQRPDELAELGRIAKTPEANIVKLPNISASIPQLKAAIAELQQHGFALPDYPDAPRDAAEKEVQQRYSKVLGSAVNPVLREGNSDRRCAASVKAHARKHPHKVTPWSKDSRTRVAHMDGGDFYGNERSRTCSAAAVLRVELAGADGKTSVLVPALKVEAGDVLDATTMSVSALRAFYARCIEEARRAGVLLSLHLKATMMKVSDPILFGHMVSVYFSQLFEKHGASLTRIGVSPRNGLKELETELEKLPAAERAAIQAELRAALERGPALAMVDSAKGITNLHVPSDVIVDASMPPMIRDGGKMWNAAGEPQDTLAVIPDRSYAGVYQATIDFYKQHGTLDPRTMGSVANVGLMAQKAEEYGSHDKTFEVERAGTVRVLAEDGKPLFEHRVEQGDVWRACLTKDAAIRDWVRLAVERARASKTPAIFWLDPARAHDRELIAKVETYLPQHDTRGLDLRILDPVAACRLSLERLAKGEDTISVTGNVLRDYLTDLFPILELGTSAKMLSIVPLLAGGGLFETGAGGSAPKHVQQFQAENYLRWDSLGEFLALQASLEELGRKSGDARTALLARTLDLANQAFLENNRSPARAVGGLDNRGSHFYLALYWAKALAEQREDAALARTFEPIARALSEQEARIVTELAAVQGRPVDVGGYYDPDDAKASAAMRPSPTFNAILGRLAS